jgi:hypothetical protein
VETGVTTTGTSGRERGSSGAGAMMGSGLITELSVYDGVVMVSLSGVEAVVGARDSRVDPNSQYIHCICRY